MIDLLIPLAAWLALVGLILVCNFARCDHSSTEGQSKRDSPSSAVATTNHSGAVSSGLALRGSSQTKETA